jgi:hypothetical protein
LPPRADIVGDVPWPQQTPLTKDYLPALARFDVQPVYLG